MNSRTVAIIPARSGSKRIPRKNMALFCGKPIISYSIHAAINSALFDTVMVSTDDQEIADFSMSCGADVPFLRSSELSNDYATTASVLVEVLDVYAELGVNFDSVCCIYPTAPFVSAGLLRKARDLFIQEKAESVVPIVKYSHPPQRALSIRNGKVNILHPENYSIRTQDFEPIYHDCGQFYFIKKAALHEQMRLICNDTVPIIVHESAMQDIDVESDFKLAELKYQALINHGNDY